MSAIPWILAYSAVILLFSLVGGLLPLSGRTTPSRLKLYLGLSSGFMLGAAFFHIMPCAMEITRQAFGWWVALGVVPILYDERVLATRGVTARDAGSLTVICLTLHSIGTGLGLAGAVQLDLDCQSAWAVILPGIALLLLIILLQPAVALAVSTILRRKGIRPGMLIVVQLGFGGTVLFGILVFHTTQDMINMELRNQITGAALGFSSGMFLVIPMVGLSPEVGYFHHDAIRKFSVLLLGFGLMGALAML